MRRLLLVLSLVSTLVACGGDGDGFGNYRFDGGVQMQICVGAEHGVSGAVVEIANLDNGSVFAQFETDGDGFFDLDGDFPDSTDGYEVVGTKGRYEAAAEVASLTTTDIEPACLDTDGVGIAAADGAHDSTWDTLDSMERPANRLEVGGAVPSDLVTVLTYDHSLDDHEVVMLGSGLPDEYWDAADEIHENLTAFLQAGGSVYVSDASWPVVEALDPGAVSFEPEGGEAGWADVTLVDRALRASLNHVTQPRMELAADDDDRRWTVVTDYRDDVEVLVAANVSHLLDEPAPVTPLALVWSPYGDEGGRLVYSSVVNPGDGSINGETWRMFMEVVLRL